jgi:hypothetical protein
MLYQYAGGHREVSAARAGQIEAATRAMARASKGRLQPIYRTDLVQACRDCEYAQRCLGPRAVVSDFPIVTADALDATDTRVRCWVNDELRQDARTADLIFDIPTLIETISRGITLQPGDVIATGTPAGVGMGLTPPRWLQPGDLVRIEIDGIGTLKNRFAHFD